MYVQQTQPTTQEPKRHQTHAGALHSAQLKPSLIQPIQQALPPGQWQLSGAPVPMAAMTPSNGGIGKQNAQDHKVHFAPGSHPDEQSKVSPKKHQAKRAEVHFFVKCDRTRVGDRVAVVGNTEGLGDWKPGRAVYLDTSPGQFPNWHGKASLPRDTILEYKYIIVQFGKTIKMKDVRKAGEPQFPAEEIKAVTWEDFGNGCNRRLNTFEKKEVFLYEEMNSTKVIEEFVEDKTSSQHEFKNAVATPGLSDQKFGVPSVSSHHFYNAAGLAASAGGTSMADLQNDATGGSMLHMAIAPKINPNTQTPSITHINSSGQLYDGGAPSPLGLDKNALRETVRQSSNKVSEVFGGSGTRNLESAPQSAPTSTKGMERMDKVGSDFKKFERQEVLEELEEEQSDLSTHRRKQEEAAHPPPQPPVQPLTPPASKPIEEDMLAVPTKPLDKSEPIIMASFLLPYTVERDKRGQFKIQKCFHNPTMLYGTLENMIRKKQYNFKWVGLITTIERLSEQDRHTLNKQFAELGAYPVFFTAEELTPYLDFYENILRPLFHNFSDLYDMKNHYLANWKDYIQLNQRVAQKILEVRREVGAKTIWIHNCHLMMVPQYVKKHFEQANIGMYFHQPFPSSSHFKLNKYRYEILKSILHCDLIAFHLFMYARNFFKTCQRLLGMDLEFLKGGYLCLNFQGKNLMIRVSHIGIEETFIKELCFSKTYKQYDRLFKEAMRPVVSLMKNNQIESEGQTNNKVFVVSSIDTYHAVSGLKQKLLSYRQFLRDYPIYQNRIVFVQFVGSMVQAFDKNEDKNKHNCQSIRNEILALRDKIHQEFGPHCLKFDESNPSLEKRMALWSQTDIILCSSLKEGLCIQVLEFSICRKIAKKFRDSVMVCSEFAGCNEAMQGVIRYNPFSNVGFIEAMDQAMSLTPEDKERRMMLTYEHITKSSMTQWIDGFLTDLKHSFNPGQTSYYLGINFSRKAKHKGVNRLMQVRQGFKKLNIENCANSLLKANKCAIIIEIESLPNVKFSRHSVPTADVIETIHGLLIDKRNTIVMLGKQSRETLLNWFGRTHSFNGNELWFAAESGYLYKAGSKENWQKLTELESVDWIPQARKIMEPYVNNIDGAFIEERQSCISFNYKNADQEHGTMFIHDLYNLLDKSLKGTSTEIIYGNGFLEAKASTVRKEKLIELILGKLTITSKLDYLFYLGNDSSDEPVYELLKSERANKMFFDDHTQKFICNLEKKPSEADFYLEDVDSVRSILEKLYNNTKKKKKIRSFADLTKITNSIAIEGQRLKKGTVNASSIANLNQFMSSKITLEDKKFVVKSGEIMRFTPKVNLKQDNLSASLQNNSGAIEEESIDRPQTSARENRSKHPSAEDPPRLDEQLMNINDMSSSNNRVDPNRRPSHNALSPFNNQYLPPIIHHTDLSAMMASLSGSNVEQLGENDEPQYSTSNNAAMLFGSNKMYGNQIDFSIQSESHHQHKSMIINSGDENPQAKEHSPHLMANSPLNKEKRQQVKNQPRSAIGLMHYAISDNHTESVKKISNDQSIKGMAKGRGHHITHRNRMNSFGTYHNDAASYHSAEDDCERKESEIQQNEGIKKISSMKIRHDSTNRREQVDDVDQVDELFLSKQHPDIPTPPIQTKSQTQSPGIRHQKPLSPSDPEPNHPLPQFFEQVKNQQSIPPAQAAETTMASKQPQPKTTPQITDVPPQVPLTIMPAVTSLMQQPSQPAQQIQTPVLPSLPIPTLQEAANSPTREEVVAAVQKTKKNLAEKILRESEKKFTMTTQQVSFCADEIDIDVDNLSK